MQASTYGGGRVGRVQIGFGSENRRTITSRRLGELKKRSFGVSSSFSDNNQQHHNCCRLSLKMGAGIARMSMDHVMRIRAKYVSVKAQASDADDDLEDTTPIKHQGKPSTSVLPYVGIACLGAILFGYHLGVVNGALEYMSKDLGIAGNAVLQGWVVSTLLAGATVGSFTGGSLADKFGRTKTFQLDAIPLAVGAYLSWTSQSVETMLVGRLLSGIGIGISSALVPLYISEISPTEIRGALGSVNQLFICIGILAALVAGLPLAGNPQWYSTMLYSVVA